MLANGARPELTGWGCKFFACAGINLKVRGVQEYPGSGFNKIMKQ